MDIGKAQQRLRWATFKAVESLRHLRRSQELRARQLIWRAARRLIRHGIGGDVRRYIGAGEVGPAPVATFTGMAGRQGDRDRPVLRQACAAQDWERGQRRSLWVSPLVARQKLSEPKKNSQRHEECDAREDTPPHLLESLP